MSRPLERYNQIKKTQGKACAQSNSYLSFLLLSNVNLARVLMAIVCLLCLSDVIELVEERDLNLALIVDTLD